jgi:hypothetical protein
MFFSFLWRCGIVDLWICGIVALWHCGIVVLWHCGIVALCYCGIVALWHCGGIVNSQILSVGQQQCRHFGHFLLLRLKFFVQFQFLYFAILHTSGIVTACHQGESRDIESRHGIGW